MIILNPYLIRKIFVAYKIGIKEFEYKNYKIKINKDYVFIDGEKIKFNNLTSLLNSKSIYMIKNSEIIELAFQTKDGRFYRLIDNGELDYFNLEISGNKLFNKNIPIKDLVKEIHRRVVGKKILIIGVKLGYYAIELYRNEKDVLVLEEDKYMIEIMKYNPFSKEFFERKIPYKISRIYSIREFPKKFFNTVIYNPPPFAKANRYYYSKVLFRDIKRIAKNKIIIDLEPPKALTTNRLIKNVSNKLGNLNLNVLVDKTNLIIEAIFS